MDGLKQTFGAFQPHVSEGTSGKLYRSVREKLIEKSNFSYRDIFVTPKTALRYPNQWLSSGQRGTPAQRPSRFAPEAMLIIS
ncbi:hypothetical protein KIN20_013165 [Parelaphostrongylus tenuis]|uniref:Uncharacterized protein n=1 Tax=Parelaphostrongylus tenuis TaxID=148309 RepID=A0AAD5MUC2_PARTN|nr:hypothetical protein KIN20_013165 [Parelaphostrongylus tenuis]